MHAKFERLLLKSLTTLEVMAYYLVVHTGHDSTIKKTHCESGIRTQGMPLSRRTPFPLGQRGPASASLTEAVFEQQCDTCSSLLPAGRVFPPPSRRLSGLFVCCLLCQQHASVSQGRICEDKFTCCHTEREVADQTFHLTQSQYTDTGPTSPSADPRTPGAWQGSHWSANFEVTGMTRPRKNPGASGIRTRDLPLSRRTP